MEPDHAAFGNAEAGDPGIAAKGAGSNYFLRSLLTHSGRRRSEEPAKRSSKFNSLPITHAFFVALLIGRILTILFMF